jgi:YegS/Rv2252/BmrU family lipid kinase
MKINFIINATSRKVFRLVQELKDHSDPHIKTADIHLTKHKGHGREMAKDIALKTDLIVAVGGDGTLNEVLNGIMDSGLEKDERPRLALIPKGSANDFARIQKIPHEVEGFIECVRNKNFRKVDIGKIHFESDNRSNYFINVADSGIGAEVVKRMEEKSIFRKILSSDLRFTLAILRTFLAFKRKDVEIHLDNTVSISGRILTLVVANSSAFGSGLIIAPDAKIDDGKFQLVLGDISLLGYLTNVGRVLKGKKISRPGVQYRDASNIKISGPVDLLTQADGELAGSGNLEIECIPEAIEFLLPETIN